MKLDIGKTYVAFRIRKGKLMSFGSYIKPAYYSKWKEGEEWISFIETDRLDNIKDIKVEVQDDYLLKQIRSRITGGYVMDYKELDKKLKNKIGGLFSSFREEIDLDFNSDEALFLRYKGWNVEYHAPKEYKSNFYKDDYFSNNFFCIPLDVAKKEYPFMFISDYSSSEESLPFLAKRYRRFIVRDFKIKQVLDLC